jgi:hypothetical protein
MANPRYAPQFEVRLGGEPLPTELRASITDVTYETGLNGADRVELTLVNDRLRWLDEPRLRLHNELTLSLGYAPDPLQHVFRGEIVSRSATFPSGTYPGLTVSALDRMHKLQEGTKVRWFAIPTATYGNFPIPDQGVAGIVSAENGLIPIFEPIGATLAVILAGVEAFTVINDPDSAQRIIRKQENESDFDFLRRIALENGWEMIIDESGPLAGRQLRFVSPLDHLSPDVQLAYGRSLIDFAPRISEVGQLISVTAHVWVAQLKTDFAITVSWDWDEMSLNISVRPSFTPLGEGPSDFLIEEPVTPSSAPRVILSHFLPRLNQRLTGTGNTIGDPSILPGRVIQLDGLGVEFGGLYRITSAAHQIGSGGYLTRFSARKEIWFGVPTGQAGAVPIRLEAPFAA